MNEDELIEYASSLAKKFDKFVIKEVRGEKRQVRFFNCRIGVIKKWNVDFMEMHLGKNRKMVSITIENPDKGKIRKACERAERLIKYIGEIPFEIGEERRYVNNKIFDESVVESEKMVEKVENAINYAEHESAGVLYGSVERVKLSNSAGIFEEDINSMACLSIRVFRGDASGHAISCSRCMENVDEKVAIDAKEIAEESHEVRHVGDDRYDVIFSPMAFSNIVSRLANFASAFAVETGYSFLQDKIGKRVANENLTVVDSGIAMDGVFSRKFDDEGVATRETKIIENGILKNYLHNSATARKFGTQTTGNAGIIEPTPWNTIVEPGDAGVDEMIEDMKHGIIITNLWYTRFHNYRKGIFSSVVRDGAFYVKNGKILHGVKGLRINDEMERLLKNVEMVGKEIKQIYWWEVGNPVFSTHVMVKGVKVSSL